MLARKTIVVWFVLLFLSLSACSTVVYKEEASEFHKAVQETRGLFNAYQEKEKEVYIAVRMNNLIRSQKVVTLSEDCVMLIQAASGYLENEKEKNQEHIQSAIAKLNVDGSKCFLEEPNPDNPEQQKKLEIPLIAGNGATLLKEMEAYAKELADIAGAEDMASLEESADGLRNALSSLAKTIGQGAGAGSKITGVINPLTTVLQRIAFNYLNHRRYVFLKQSVETARPLIPNAADLLSQQAAGMYTNVALGKFILLNASLTNADDPKLARSERDVLYRELVEQENALHTLIAENPMTAFRDMREAHEQLAVAIENKSTQREAVFAAMRKFADEVDSLRKAIEALNQ